MLERDLKSNFVLDEHYKMTDYKALLDSTIDAMIKSGTLVQGWSSKGTLWALSEKGINAEDRRQKQAALERQKQLAVEEEPRKPEKPQREMVSMQLVDSVLAASMQDPAMRMMIMAKIRATNSQVR